MCPDDNKAARKGPEHKQDKTPKRAEEVMQLMSNSMDFVKELMEENEKLRYWSVQLQEQNRELSEGVASGQRGKLLQQQLEKLEQEKRRLLQEYQKVEDENKNFASRYVEIEEENNNLANLYVCSFQLHSTLDFNEVLQIIMEIIINLIGAEDFGVLLLDDKSSTLHPVAVEGLSKEHFPPIPVGQGVIGQAVQTGENYYSPDLEDLALRGKREPHDPLVCVPLKIREQTIGVIVLYKLLPQKTQFAHVDYELFTLLAGHAATAIFSAKLYSQAKRKLDTIKGFMELLTSG